MATWRPPVSDPYVDLADEAAHEAAVRARAEERSLRDRAAETAEFVGTLRDLAERGAGVVVGSRSGRLHRGVLVAVAHDYISMRLPAGQEVALASEALTTVRPEPGLAATVAMGDRERAQDRTLLELLDRMGEERRWIALTVDGTSEALQGALVAVGEDICTLRLDGHDRSMVYVRVAAVLEVVIDRA